MAIYFVTGNSNKVTQARRVIPELEQLDINLEEIQDDDPHKIISAKLQEAIKTGHSPVVVEDTSLYFDCLEGKLPGPFIKWFEKLGLEKMYQIALAQGNYTARAQVIVGYHDGQEMNFFESFLLEGNLVPPRGDRGFGWDPIFLPNGSEKTLAEMAPEEKAAISMRNDAFTKLRDFLNKKA